MDSDIDFNKVQVLLEDFLILHGISKNLAPLVFELASFINAHQKHIIINSFLKKELASRTEISKGTIDNSISKLNEVGILQRIDRGTYKPHPLLLNIQNILNGKTVELTITYLCNN